MLTYNQKVIEGRHILAVKITQGEKEIVREFDVAAADALARELALQAAISAGPLVTVQMGTDFLVLEKKVAQAIAKALTIGKLRLEEIDQAERIARDSAILMRAGAGFALSNDERIIDDAKVIAAWDSTLRKCMAGGIKSEAVVGTPSVIRGPAPAVQP